MKHLGDFVIEREFFPKLEKTLKEFRSKEFQALSALERVERVGRVLLEWIDEAPEGFLLVPVLDYVEKINQENIIEHFHFNNFELWLNQYAGLSPEDNLRIRGKIAGRYVPRDAYQLFFPVGMGRSYPGSHIVTAHGSPDLDTTVASFWGWVDAFACRVADGLHIWNIPGGQPPPQVETTFLFYHIFGHDIFSHLAKHRTTLSVSGLDLVTQQGVDKKQPHDAVLDIEHEKGPQAVVMVDDQGFYLGEWRNTDAERVRSVINLVNQCLRWYENHLHVKLISVFANEELTKKDLKEFYASVLEMKIEECEPAQDFTKKQKLLVDDYLKKVLNVKKGLKSSFEEFAKAMSHLSLSQFEEFISLVDTSSVFDKQGNLIENRPHLFGYLAEVIGALQNAIYSVRKYVDKLGVALQVKSKVFGLMPNHINYRADLEEIRSKIDNFPYLTVTASDREGRIFPVGVIHASDIFKMPLGTVTLRDFSNREETKIPPFLEVISVIDHHKTQLTTELPPVIWITDSQSSNTLIAELSFKITDVYSMGGLTLKAIEQQMKEVQKNLDKPSNQRILQRLLQKSLAHGRKASHFISHQREIVEYFHYLYAILDDTDLLTKVSTRDVECIASLLNRLKTLTTGIEVEVIHFDDIDRDAGFVKKAASRILQNDDMFSLVRKIYHSKEQTIEENLLLAAQGKPSHIFVDTKIQNGCCRVGQTKLFGTIFPTFAKHANSLRKQWFTEAKKAHEEKPEVDLHLHMISTIPGAEELYKGKEGAYKHHDELWIWIPPTETAVEHLKSFLSSFKASPSVAGNPMEVEFLGDNAKELKQIFEESFGVIPIEISHEKLSIAVLRFKAGTINSRKAMISPYLPRFA